MKLSTVFHSTYAKVKELLESNKPIRDGEWTATEVEFIKDHMGEHWHKPSCMHALDGRITLNPLVAGGLRVVM